MPTKTAKHTYFYISDHLGSTSMVLDGDGNISQSVTYIPYSELFIEERNGTWNTPYLFNGKELDEETGLYYYRARYLNSISGMWLSVDPL
jgi:RHS repeat-associated protein